MFKQLSQRYFTLILVLLIIIIGTLGFTFALRPSLNAYQTARAELNDFVRDYQNVENSLRKSQNLESELQRFSAGEIEKLDYFFVPAPEMAHLLAVVKSKAQAARFLLTALDAGQGASERDGEPIEDVNVQLQLKGGGYDEFKELLKLFTRAVPLIDISSFVFDPQSASVSVNLKAHRLKKDMAQSAVPIDASFFADPRFSALSSPVLLPDIAPVGRVNPFALIN